MAFQNELPTDWTGRTAAQKIDYYNTQGITPEQLTAAGVSGADIGWMQGQGYNVGNVAPAPIALAPAPAPAFSVSTLPTDWGTAGGAYDTAKQKIDYFNAQGITPEQLKSVGVSDADIQWMQGVGGYNVGAPAPAPAPAFSVSTLPTDWGVAGGAYDTAKEKIDYYNELNVTPDQLVKAGVSQSDIDWMKDSGYIGLPKDWSTYTPQDKIDYFNEFGFTSKQLENAGVAPQDIDWMTKNGYVVDKVFDSFGGATSAPAQLSGILSGFEALGRGDFTEDQAKKLVGQDRFDQYKTQFGDTLKSGIADILSDKQLSGEEALTAVQTARKYGLDVNEISDLTGYDKKLFEAINEGYDSTVKNIVYSALSDKSDVDKIKGILTLEQMYGFTDEDIAKASGLNAEDLKGYIDPVRNLETDLQKTFTKPDASSKDILSFIETAKKNTGVDAIYGDKLDALAEKYKNLDQQWGGADGFQRQNIYDQINKITNAVGGKNWTGSWSGQGGDSAMRTAAAMLNERGVDNLADLKTEKTEDSEGNPIYKLIDKSTGKTIATSSDKNDFTIHSYDTGNFFKSEDKRFAIRMTDDGVPIPYQTTQKSGFLYSPAFPIMASLLLPGIGSTISGGLASAGGSSLAAGTLANTALTQGILSGGMAALTGGDVLKSALVGAAGAPISAGISSLLPTGMDPNLAKIATNVGTTAATSALAGRPMNLQGALINAGLQYGAQQLPLNLSPQQVNLLAGVATPYLQGQSISPTQLTGILANYALKSQQPQKGAR